MMTIATVVVYCGLFLLVLWAFYRGFRDTWREHRQVNRKPPAYMRRVYEDEAEIEGRG